MAEGRHIRRLEQAVAQRVRTIQRRKGTTHAHCCAPPGVSAGVTNRCTPAGGWLDKSLVSLFDLMSTAQVHAVRSPAGKDQCSDPTQADADFSGGNEDASFIARDIATTGRLGGSYALLLSFPRITARQALCHVSP